MHFMSARRLPIAGITLLLWASGCGRGNISTGSNTLEGCLRDREALSRLLVQPVSCNVSEECPAGSHCKDGICDWQCYSDSDCGANGVCTCDGWCLGADDVPGRDIPDPDPSCPRNLELLTDPDTLERHCLFDEHCPYGSHCDRSTSTCSYECLGTDHAEAGCEPEMVCDCRGLCVTPGENDTPLSAVAIVISLSDRRLPFSSVQTDPQTFCIQLRVASGSFDDAEDPVVSIKAPAGFELSSDASSDVGQHIELDQWQWDFEDDEPGTYLAQACITVAAVLPLDDDDAPWQLNITSGAVVPNHNTVLLAPSPTDQGPPPYSGTYAGYLILEGGSQGSSRDPVTRIPVKAFTSKNTSYLLLIDDSAIFAPGGSVGLHLVEGYTTEFIYLVKQRDSSANAGKDSVQMVATLATLASPGIDSDGDLHGGLFALWLPTATHAPLLFSLELDRIAELTANECKDDDDCAKDEYCEPALDLCAPGADWESSHDFGNYTAHTESAAWNRQATWMVDNQVFGDVYDAPWAERLVCYDPEDPMDGNVISQLGMTLFGPYLIKSAQALQLQRHSGDLRCLDGRIARAISLESQRDAEDVQQPHVLGAADLLRTCLDELAVEPPRELSGAVYDMKIAYFGNEVPFCVSPARIFPALRWAFSGVLDGEPGRINSARNSRLGQRLVAQWIALQSFLGRQGREEAHLDQALPSAVAGTTWDAIELEELIDRLEKDWELILDPAISEPLASTPRDGLRYPDYRQHPRPVGYWTFDQEDMDGQYAVDLVGSSHVRLRSPYSHPAGDGGIIPTNQWVSIPAGETGISGDLTVSMWVEVPGAGANQTKLMWSYGEDSARQYEFGLKSSSTTPRYLYPYARHSSDAGTQFVRFDTVHLDPGQRVHLVFVRDTSDKSYLLSIDGANPLKKDYTTNPNLKSTTGGTLGLRAYADDYAIWDVPLDHVQLHNLHLLGRNVPGGDDDLLLHQPIEVLDENTKREQLVGLPVHLLEGLTEYLLTLEAYVEQKSTESYGSCLSGAEAPVRQAALARVAHGLRMTLALEALAEELVQRASAARECTRDEHCAGLGGATCETFADEDLCALGDEPVFFEVPWQAHLLEARGELEAVRARLVQKANVLHTCQNPLGIQEDMLPLYFGDVSGDNSRFFASSDYLIDTWAAPAVAAAQGTLEAARTSWLNQRNSEVQQLQNEYARERQLEQIESVPGAEIIRLCGLSGVDPLEVNALFDPSRPGALDPDSCFINLQQPGCGGTNPPTTCYRGVMGSAAIAILSAQQNVEIARSAAEAAEGRYEQQSLFCSEKQEREEGVMDAITEHVKRMNALRFKRDTASTFGSFLGAIGSAITGNPSELLSFGADTLAKNYSTQIECSEAAFQAHLQQHSIQEGILLCFHEADMLKYGIDTEYQTIEAALINVESSLLELINLKERVRQLLREGEAAVEREQRRTLPSVAHHYWLDEKVARFRKDFAWAKRLVYLGMRAAEYELQQSLDLRDAILEATHPDELADALRVLDQERAGRTINGRRPEESSLVLSLRDDIMQLASRDDVLPGERDWKASRRFGEMLMSPEFAVYDELGNYLGQGVSFGIKEQGAFKLRCAERLWRLAATIQGDLLDVHAPGAPIFLLKRNTFASQWCQGKGDGSPYQVGSVRPSAQLFHPDGDMGSEAENASYVSAMLFPWFNVTRSQFYQEAYREGSSEELAGRGLYGQYIILFPEDGLLDHTSETQDAFPLDRVEDVLIRFDFLSVDDLEGL